MVWSKYCKRFKTAFNKLTMASKSPPNKDSFSVSLSNARNQIEDLNLWNWNVTTTNYSTEMWGLYSTKCPCERLQICNILFFSFFISCTFTLWIPWSMFIKIQQILERFSATIRFRWAQTPYFWRVNQLKNSYLKRWHFQDLVLWL